ncbi:unnamed protein product [Sphagnum jensenii]|uniref:Uncharacterized protein n=1 Tax=Sphagnum jensenii TaxID=128206 RepID=A0ABP0WX56_9BRYO
MWSDYACARADEEMRIAERPWQSSSQMLGCGGWDHKVRESLWWDHRSDIRAVVGSQGQIRLSLPAMGGSKGLGFRAAITPGTITVQQFLMELQGFARE